MGFLGYLRDRLATIVCLLLAIAVQWFVLTSSGVDFGIRQLCTFALLLLLVCGALADWVRQRAFWSQLHSLGNLDEGALERATTIARPPFATGETAWDALDALTHDAQGRVATQAGAYSEYRDYIEAWVHEVKTPIAASRLVIENNPSPASSAVASELDRIDGYVEQALFYARSGSVDRDYVIRPANLRDIVSGVVRARARSLIEHGIHVSLESLDEEVPCDAKWLAFVVGQLVDNATKYRATPADGREPSLAISAKRLDEGLARERVVLTVSDNGVGIPAADVGRVFDKGFVGDNGRAEGQPKSTGLGLYLARRLCDKMGVGLDLTSVQGQGTSVHITLPSNHMHYLTHGE